MKTKILLIWKSEHSSCPSQALFTSSPIQLFFFCLLVSASASSGLDSTAREVGNFPGLSLVLDFLHFLQNLLFCFPFAHSKVMWLRETTENDSLKKISIFIFVLYTKNC